MGQETTRFDLQVGGSDTRYVQEGTVRISLGSSYWMKLINLGHTKCDARVTLESEHIATWRIDARSSIVIEIDPRTDRELKILKRGKHTLRVRFEPERSSKRIVPKEEDHGELVLQKSREGSYVEVPALDQDRIDANEVEELSLDLCAE